MSHYSKPRILFVGEFSLLSTGFAVHQFEFKKRFYESGKYEVAELACYIGPDDPRINSLPWKVYPGKPHPNDVAGNQAFNARPSSVFGEWCFDAVCLNFRPTHVCLPPGHLVKTSKGYIPIQDVKVGDLVLTHKGRYKKVLSTGRREFKGKITNVRLNGCTTGISLTDEHPIYVHKKRNQTNRKKSNKLIYESISPTFEEAGSLKSKDIACFPLPKKEITNQTLDLTDYLDNYQLDGVGIRYSDSGNFLKNRFIKFDKDFSRFIGYVVSDGHIHRAGLRLFFNLTEMRFAKDCKQIISNKFGLETKIQKHKTSNMLVVSVNSMTLARIFNNLINSKNKKIPEIFWTTCKENIEGILCGLIRGDGCYKRTSISLCTVKKNLAHEYRLLLTKLNIPSCLHKNQNAYEIEVSGKNTIPLKEIVNKYEKDIYVGDGRDTSPIWFTKNEMCSSIKRVRKYDYNGLVYNLEVADDNSYVVEQFCVHNCMMRDFWMDNWVEMSNSRPYFQWIEVPTVDSEPQNYSWLQLYRNCDAIFTYSDYGLRTLKREGPGLNNLQCSIKASSHPAYQKIDKKIARNHLGIPEDAFVVGTVMRNQIRKLYPELFRSFAKALSGRDMYLYCHSAFPDLGWDFPRLLREFGITNQVLFSYICKKCSAMYASVWNGCEAPCKKCGEFAAVTPNTGYGFPPEVLSLVYNSMDLYMQVANSEGFAVPVVEAAQCGVPTAVVNYSAMEDFVINLKSEPINNLEVFRDHGTQAYRSVPNYQTITDLIKAYYGKSKIELKQISARTKHLCSQHYDTDKCFQVLDEYIEQSPKDNLWDASPLILKEPVITDLSGLSNLRFVNHLIENWLQRPDLLGGYFWEQCIRNLETPSPQAPGFNREQLINITKTLLNNRKLYENARSLQKTVRGTQQEA